MDRLRIAAGAGEGVGGREVRSSGYPLFLPCRRPLLWEAPLTPDLSDFGFS